MWPGRDLSKRYGPAVAGWYGGAPVQSQVSDPLADSARDFCCDGSKATSHAQD